MYYDFEGNLIRRVQRIESTPGTFTEGIVQKYYYDHRNRMIKVENFATPNDATATIPRPSYKVDYGYDAFDRRVYKVTTSYTYATNGTIATTRVTVQRFVWLLDHVQMELNQRGEVTDRYLNGPMVDQVFANEAAPATVSGVTYAGGLMWLLGDNQNTVRDVVMRSGTDTSSVTIHRTYSAFGRITTETTPTSGAAGTLGTSVNLITAPNTDIAYTGRDLDRTTGFQYHRARWYAPYLRRFTQKDPWVWGGGDTNLYRYVGNSPANGTDSSGNAMIFTNKKAADLFVSILTELGAKWVQSEEFKENYYVWTDIRDADSVFGFLDNRYKAVFRGQLTKQDADFIETARLRNDILAALVLDPATKFVDPSGYDEYWLFAARARISKHREEKRKDFPKLIVDVGGTGLHAIDQRPYPDRINYNITGLVFQKPIKRLICRTDTKESLDIEARSVHKFIFEAMDPKVYMGDIVYMNRLLTNDGEVEIMHPPAPSNQASIYKFYDEFKKTWPHATIKDLGYNNELRFIIKCNNR